jgi:DNA-binding NarL/FixJ family response regulator
VAIRILLVDDHALVRTGIALLLQAESDFSVVGETGDGGKAVELAQELKPDVALVDLAMPGTTGVQVLSALRTHCPEVKVIMLSMYSTEEHVVHAMRAGASGYVPKSAAPQELVSAVRTVCGGGTWLPTQISRQVLDNYLRRIHAEDPPNLLTARQREILRMIAEGSSTKQIAALLGVSVKTIESHRAQIMGKLDIRDAAGLVRYAIRNGIAEL